MWGEVPLPSFCCHRGKPQHKTPTFILYRDGRESSHCCRPDDAVRRAQKRNEKLHVRECCKDDSVSRFVGLTRNHNRAGDVWWHLKGGKTAENPSCFTLCISFLIKSPDIHQFSSAFIVWRLVTMSDDHCERVTGCGRTGTSPKRCDQRLNFQEGRFDRHKKRDDNSGSLFEHVAECFEQVSRGKKKVREFRWTDKPLSLFLGWKCFSSTCLGLSKLESSFDKLGFEVWTFLHSLCGYSWRHHLIQPLFKASPRHFLPFLELQSNLKAPFQFTQEANWLWEKSFWHNKKVFWCLRITPLTI